MSLLDSASLNSLHASDLQRGILVRVALDLLKPVYPHIMSSSEPTASLKFVSLMHSHVGFLDLKVGLGYRICGHLVRC